MEEKGKFFSRGYSCHGGGRWLFRIRQPPKNKNTRGDVQICSYVTNTPKYRRMSDPFRMKHANRAVCGWGFSRRGCAHPWHVQPQGSAFHLMQPVSFSLKKGTHRSDNPVAGKWRQVLRFIDKWRCCVDELISEVSRRRVLALNSQPWHTFPCPAHDTRDHLFLLLHHTPSGVLWDFLDGLRCETKSTNREIQSEGSCLCGKGTDRKLVRHN